jgi:hypothetical protein
MIWHMHAAMGVVSVIATSIPFFSFLLLSHFRSNKIIEVWLRQETQKVVGSAKEKVLPCPNVLCTQMRPP